MSEKKIEDFHLFKMLFIPNEVKTLKKDIKRLEKESFNWFKKYFNTVFGTTTRCDTKDVITYHYSVGLLMFGIPSLGDYYYKFIIEMIHYENWQLKEWKDGFMYGKYCAKSKMKVRDNNYRDGNPYSETDFFRRSAWDAGYIMGLSNFSFKPFIKQS